MQKCVTLKGFLCVYIYIHCFCNWDQNLLILSGQFGFKRAIKKLEMTVIGDKANDIGLFFYCLMRLTQNRETRQLLQAQTLPRRGGREQ